MHYQSQELLDYSIIVKENYFDPTRIVLLSRFDYKHSRLILDK